MAAKTAPMSSNPTDGRSIIYRTLIRGSGEGLPEHQFCTVLKQNPDGGTWGPCSTYWMAGQERDVKLPRSNNEIPGVVSFRDS